MNQEEFDRQQDLEAEDFTRRCREYSARKRQALTNNDPATKQGHDKLIACLIHEVQL